MCWLRSESVTGVAEDLALGEGEDLGRAHREDRDAHALHVLEAAGHVMFTRSLLDAPRRLVEVHVLSPLAAMPGYQKRGIGSALVRKGLKALAMRAVPLVFLEGDPGYYSRFGFAPGGDLGFRKPSLRIPDGAFQAIRLPAHEPWMTGTLVYAEPFWRHDCVGLRDPSA